MDRFSLMQIVFNLVFLVNIFYLHRRLVAAQGDRRAIRVRTEVAAYGPQGMAPGARVRRNASSATEQPHEPRIVQAGAFRGEHPEPAEGEKVDAAADGIRAAGTGTKPAAASLISRLKAWRASRLAERKGAPASSSAPSPRRRLLRKRPILTLDLSDARGNEAGQRGSGAAPSGAGARDPVRFEQNEAPGVFAARTRARAIAEKGDGDGAAPRRAPQDLDALIEAAERAESSEALRAMTAIKTPSAAPFDRQSSAEDRPAAGRRAGTASRRSEDDAARQLAAEEIRANIRRLQSRLGDGLAGGTGERKSGASL
jgi:hypothetical protein